MKMQNTFAATMKQKMKDPEAYLFVLAMLTGFIPPVLRSRQGRAAAR